MASRPADAEYLSGLHSLDTPAVPGLPAHFACLPPHQQLAQQRAMQAAQKAKAAVERKTAEDEAADDHVVNDAAADEQEDEDLYTLYKPAKMREGYAHPDPIVETASLAGVLPPDPRYKHSLQDIADAKLISDAQLETVVYANDRFAQNLPTGERAGFFLGDGAGVGKGRQIAALIKDQWKQGHRRCIWISVSTDLRYDAQRDLDDIHAKGIRIVPEGGGTLPKGKLEKAFRSGVLFITYSLLVVGAKHWASKASKNAGEELNTAIDKTSRLHQIIEWLGGGEGDPIIVLDECHKAKNLLSTKGASHTGLAVCALQKELPKARVLYSSATGASEPNNLAYMVRLSNAGFDNMKDMIIYLRSAGLGSLELYAMGLKATGSYLSRTLSYNGAEFNIAKERIDPVFGRLYDASTRFWSLLYFVCQSADMGRSSWRLFWSAQLRFYRQMLMAAKVPACARLAQEAVASGMCAVIGLQSTGEANTKAAAELDDVLDDFVSAPQMVLIQFLTKHLPVTRPKNSSSAQLDQLLGKVFDAVEEWRVHGMEHAPPSAAAMASAAAAAAAAAQDNGAVSTPSAARQQTAEAAQGTAPEAADDDDDVEMMGEMNEEQAREKKRLEAIQAGRFLDLSEEDGTEAVAPEITAKSLAKLAEQEEAIAQKERQVKLAPLMDRRGVAMEAVKAAEAELQKVTDEAAAKEATAKEAAGKGGEEAGQAKGGGRLLRRVDSGTAAAAEGTANGYAKGRDQGMQEASGGSPAVAPKGRKRVLLLEESDESDNENISPSSRQAAAAQPRKQRKALSSDTEASAQQEDGVPAAKGGSAGAKSSSSPEVVAITKKQQRKSTVAVDSDDDMVVSSPVKPGRKAGAAVVKQEQKSAAVKLEGKAGKKGKAAKPAAKSKGKRKAIRVDSDEESSKASIPSEDESSSDEDDSSSEGSDDSDDASDDSEILKQAKRLKPSREAAPISARTRMRGCSQLTLQGAMKRAGGKPMSIQEMAARRRLTEAQKDLQEAEADIEEFELCAAEEATEQYDDDTRSAETGGTSNRSGKKKKHRASPEDRKPAKPQYAVKRKELYEGWNEDDDEADMEDMDGAEVDDAGFDETGDRPPCRQMVRLRRMLLRAAAALELPPNPLDHLTELLGGQEKVAEMTGRQGMLVRQADGTVTYQKRRAEEAQKMVNLREKESFMRGDKLCAIISEAASVGISLQADRRVKNQRRRCHLTLELPWSADKAVQQFGRSHRSNQTSAPIYRIIVTSCGGEYRFAASAAKRLQSLGALLRGDRRALGAGADLKEFDIDNKFGKQGLDRACGIICGSRAPMDTVELPKLPADIKAMLEEQTHGELDDETAFYRYMQDAMLPVGLITRDTRGKAAPAKPSEVVSSFLNRLLAMPLAQQELLFNFFSDVMDALIAEAKSKGGYDEGIVSIRAQGAAIMTQDVIHSDKASSAKTFHTVINLNRGLSWEKALEFRDACVDEAAAEGVAVSRNVGFFKDSRVKDWGKTGHPRVMVTSDVKRTVLRGQRMVRCQRPNSSIGPSIEERVLRDTYTRISDAEARKHWEFWYDWSGDRCMHGKECTLRKAGRNCMYGSRITELHMINGAVLPLLKCLSDTVGRSGYGRGSDGKKPPTRVAHVTLDDGTPLLGLTLNPNDAYLVREKVEAVFGAVDPDAADHPQPSMQAAGERATLPNGQPRMPTAAARASASAAGGAAANGQPKPKAKPKATAGRVKTESSRPEPGPKAAATVIEIE